MVSAEMIKLADTNPQALLPKEIRDFLEEEGNYKITKSNTPSVSRMLVRRVKHTRESIRVDLAHIPLLELCLENIEEARELAKVQLAEHITVCKRAAVYMGQGVRADLGVFRPTGPQHALSRYRPQSTYSTRKKRAKEIASINGITLVEAAAALFEKLPEKDHKMLNCVGLVS